MSIDILKTVAVQETKKFCDEHEIELGMKEEMMNLSDFYKAQAKPIAFDLIAHGISSNTAWNIAFDQVRHK